MQIKNTHFLKLLDYSPSEISFLLDLAHHLKREKKSGAEKKYLRGKNIALIFEKTSTRTRCAFEVAAYDQGANVTYLESSNSQIGHKESIKDTARVLGRMFDAIEYRGYGQHIVDQLAQYSGVPVFNGLTNEFHPTQILADFMTMQEHSKKPLHELSFCYLGDARNNMGNSLMVGAAKMGVDFRACAPLQYQPQNDLVEQCQKIASETGAKITISDNVDTSLSGADFVYTDVWVSMGEPEDEWDKRIEALLPYRVSARLLEKTHNKQVKFMHCLPAYHDKSTEIGKRLFEKYGLDGVELTNEVFESEASIVFDQAENRMHSIKAVMVALLSKTDILLK
jgi:ornithine carbamoyltransferase